MTPWDQLLIFFTGLFSIVNPVGAVPVWLMLTADRTEQDKKVLLCRVSRNMLFMLLAVLLFGTFILTFFGITVTAIRIAGAFMIIINAFNMLRNGPKLPGKSPDAEREDISFAPLTMPLLVGPGTIAIVLSYSNELGYAWTSWQAVTQYGFLLMSILAVTVASYIVLRYSSKLLRLLGNTGLVALSKIMGFILLSIGVQILLVTLHTLYFA
ncbi:MAG: MarC family protein [Bacteroidetes bacterium]|nr:MarC family protein [Bacteroidota bacterium]